MSKLRVRPRVRWTIARVMTLGMVALISVLMATTTVLDVMRARSIFRDELEQRAVLMAETLVDVLADPLYSLDIDELRDLEKVVGSQRDVVHFQVFDPNGRIVVDSNQDGQYPEGTVSGDAVMAALEGRQTVLWLVDDVLQVGSPIEVGSEVIGGVRLGLDTRPLDAEIIEIARQRTWQALGLLAAGILVSYLAAQYFIRPIRRLVEAAIRVAGGDLDFSADDGRDDEIGDLAVAFENMTGSLKESQQRVLERTEELV